VPSSRRLRCKTNIFTAGSVVCCRQGFELLRNYNVRLLFSLFSGASWRVEAIDDAVLPCIHHHDKQRWQRAGVQVVNISSSPCALGCTHCLASAAMALPVCCQLRVHVSEPATPTQE